MRVIVCNVSIGGWYPRGAARLINSMHEHSFGFEIQAHVNVLPFGAPANVIEGDRDYTGYCAKPFALLAARNSGADIAILVDSAFYAVRSIHPLVDHIAEHGYYLCKNGNKVGEWTSDRCLERMGVSRSAAWEMEEASSYCVGLNFADGRCMSLLHHWCGFAADRLTFPGPHTGLMHEGRNRGFVSVDPKVKGHRHDQSVISILAHRYGMTEFVDRPRFTSYAGHETEETVLVNEGM